jgi:DNA repair protein RadC
MRKQLKLFPDPAYQVAEIQLSYKSKIPASERPKISGSKDAYDILKFQWNENTLELQEEFKILMLNRANRVIGLYEASKGGIAGTVADPKLIFAATLLCGASGIILAHCHPSGNLTPSQADLDLTKKLHASGKLLDIQVLDHIILAGDKYNSLADEGLMP